MTMQFLYLFDPLCGWCYGASAGIATLAAQPGVTIEALATGLFAGDGARTMSGGMRDHIVASDQRIATMTGAIFTDAYRDRVIGDGGFRLDSGPAMLALTAVTLSDAGRELDALAMIQRARYIDGRDITDVGTLGALLREAGFDMAAATLAAPASALLDADAARRDRAVSIMRRFGISGVPGLLRNDDGVLTAIDTAALYEDPRSLLLSTCAA